MIDERINNSLKEIETQLKNVESARKQVEKTVNSFDGLNTTTTDYVQSLNAIKTKLDEVVKLVGIDYKSKVAEFEKDRTAIVKSANEVIAKVDNKVNDITELVETNVDSTQKKLFYTLALNGVILVALIVMYLTK